MKEGAMCLGYFCDKFRVLSSPTQYHLLFKTYKQAAMHWVTSESSLLMRRSWVRVPPQVPTRVAQLVERQYSHPRNSRLLFKRNKYNRRLCVDLLLCMGHLCHRFESCPPDYQNKPREVAQLVEQSVLAHDSRLLFFYMIN